MAIVVEGGSGRGVGKTALICGLIAALPEYCWTAVKISTHAHGLPQPVWEETEPAADLGQGTDTARYLAAGAHRALFVSAGDDELGRTVLQLIEEEGPAGNLIIESNRILRHLKPDLCLAVAGGTEEASKPSFTAVVERMDAMVVLAERDHVVGGDTPEFHLRALERISPEMLGWLCKRLAA